MSLPLFYPPPFPIGSDTAVSDRLPFHFAKYLNTVKAKRFFALHLHLLRILPAWQYEPNNEWGLLMDGLKDA